MRSLRRDRSNVSITVLCPGPVDTNFNNRAGVSFSVKPMSPKYIAEYAVNRALSHKLFCSAGTCDKDERFASRFAPERLLAALVYNVQKAKEKTADKTSETVSE